jgi:hypothetical protein
VTLAYGELPDDVEIVENDQDHAVFSVSRLGV